MPAVLSAEKSEGSSRASGSSLRHYELKKQVYKGAVSRVYEAFDRRDGAHVCLKVYKSSAMNELQRAQLDRELDIHSRLSHPNIAELHDAFEDDRAVYLVQEFVDGGDLYTDLKMGGKFDEYRAAGTVIAPLLQALCYIHGKGIIHRDIKAENVLVDPNGTVKLADFGFAIDTNEDRPGSRLGTWEYMAPEIHMCPFKSDSDGKQPATTYCAAIDIWAVGILAFELLTGLPPFPKKNGEISHTQLMNSELQFPAWMSPDAKSFIKVALSKDPDMRPSARQLLKHRWLRAFQKDENTSKAVASGPSAGSILSHMPTPARKSPDAQVFVTMHPALNGESDSAAADAAFKPNAVVVASDPAGHYHRRAPAKVQSLHNLVFNPNGVATLTALAKGAAGAAQQLAAMATAAPMPPGGPSAAQRGSVVTGPPRTPASALAGSPPSAGLLGKLAMLPPGSPIAMAQGSPAGALACSPMARDVESVRARRFSAVEGKCTDAGFRVALPVGGSASLLPTPPMLASSWRGHSGALVRYGPDAGAADATVFVAAARAATSASGAASEPLVKMAAPSIASLAKISCAVLAPMGRASLSEPLPESPYLLLPQLKVARSAATSAQGMPGDLALPSAAGLSALGAPPGAATRVRRGSMVMALMSPASPTAKVSPGSPLLDQAGVNGMNGIDGVNSLLEGRGLSAASLAALSTPGGFAGLATPGITPNRFARASRLGLVAGEIAVQQ